MSTPAPAATPEVAAQPRPATEPPEARGVPRDGVRLLVARPDAVTHALFADLPDFLVAGDLVVVNTSATLAAAVDGVRGRGGQVTVHFSTALGADSWAVELRPAVRATGPLRDVRPGDMVALPGGVTLTVRSAYPEAGVEGSRLWRADLRGAGDVPRLLARHGRAIAYGYVPGRWSLESYQTVFAREPGSAEMPSAGRPFTTSIVTALVAAGVAVAPVLLHAGVSSQEHGELPLPERYRVPTSTARQVNLARATGGRVVAVGTTVTRALESAATVDGTVRPGGGWTDLVLGPDRPARVVDGLVTGWHDPGTSHLQLLEAVGGGDLVGLAYAAARAAGYLWHEFGDSALLLPD